MAAGPTFELKQRGTFPVPGWSPSRWPRLSFYSCALFVCDKRATPWFARLDLQWGRSAFWFYVWPWPRVDRMRRIGRRRLLPV